MCIPLVNVGWGAMENSILRFDIIPDGYSYDNFELPHYPFELDLGNIDSFKFSRNSLDIEECFKEAGVDVELLNSLQEFSRSDRQYIYFPPANSIAHPFEQSDQAINGEKRLSMTEYKSLLKGALGSFQNGEAIIVGELNYVETNHEGHKIQRTNQLKYLVNLTKKTPLYEKFLYREPPEHKIPESPAPPSSEYSIGFENQEENSNKVKYKFATQEDNYQVVLPEVSHELKKGETDRFLVCIEVEKSSIHDFNIILIYNNSEQLESQDIKLELFRPFQWSD
jgi:hypothetical protein